MSFSKALLSINDISGLMTFLNDDNLSFIQVDRVNIILKSDLNTFPTLYHLDENKQLQRYEYNADGMPLHSVANDDYTHKIEGEALYLSYPQLINHPAYIDVNSYYKVPLTTANQQLGAIEFINIQQSSEGIQEKKLKLFNNMIATMVEHIIEHELASNAAQQLNNERKNFQVLVDVTNAVISKSTKKDLITSLLKFIYQHFGMRDLSIIQVHEGHYNQHSCSYSGGNIDYHSHFFTNAQSIKQVIENKKPLFLDEDSIRGLSFETNAPFFPSEVKSACVVPMVFRSGTVGYICYMQRQERTFLPDDVVLFGQIAARVALAMHSLKVHEARSKTRAGGKYISIEDSYMEHAIFDDIISQSEAMNQVLDQVTMVADCDSTVLILGESGTGKELIAQAIHKMSRRSGTRMVKMNCAAVPAGLFESELFGHERGAFTGAISKRVGRFEEAHKGTLFLDEIGDMPLELQPKLLRALQENEIERVGKNQQISVDVRIVVATNADLDSMVESKAFRSDLYYRLNVFPILIPPLRERPEDIPLLVKHFTRVISKKMGKNITDITVEAMDVLSRCAWPGNVRQLRNFIERSVILTRGQVLNVPVAELQGQGTRPTRQTAEPIFEVEPAPKPVATDNGFDRDAIIDALRRSNGIISGPRGAATKLGLKRTTLLSRMQKMGIKSQDYLEEADEENFA
ncbi:sigma 54-interacting transcriptional regulator [Dongshaea marina]|uniref:sigma 54-interacting transcriptional regulator n=1 Tax=Dongshaea marina TaxID=2047966 RepID=UPI0019024901|nr:sigma 54-interacting transcriptional regulator [Dongshaea marina]